MFDESSRYRIDEIIEKYPPSGGGVSIYVIGSGDVDPSLVENCRYVGLTCTGVKVRLASHIASALRKDNDNKFTDNSYRARWMRKELAAANGNKKIFKIKEIAVDLSPRKDIESGAGKAEDEIINAYRSLGARLTNLRSGGAGCTASEDVKRITKNEYQKKYAAERRSASPEFTEYQREKNRISARKKYWSDEQVNLRLEKLKTFSKTARVCRDKNQVLG